MSLGKTVHVLSPKMADIGQVVLEVRAAIVSYINSSFCEGAFLTRTCDPGAE